MNNDTNNVDKEEDEYHSRTSTATSSRKQKKEVTDQRMKTQLHRTAAKKVFEIIGTGGLQSDS